MTVEWALAGCAILLAALAASRTVLRRSSAAVRHFMLATAFASVLVAPLATLMLPSLTPVRQFHATVVMVVSPGDARQPGLPARVRDAAPMRTATWLWFGGAVMLLSRILFALDQRRRHSQPAPPATAQLGAGIARELGIGRPVRFEQSPAAVVAETRGAFRPAVTLPATATNWPEERMRVVLTHELIHVARNDWAIAILAEAVAALHWFNPLAWIALRDLRREREIACDDAVLSFGVDNADYAGHLLEVVRSLRAGHTAPSVAMAQASHLEARIRSILKPDLPRGGVSMKLQFGAAAFAACLLTAISVVQAPAQSGAAALSGVVMDATSGRIPNASVIVRNNETKKVEIVRTSETGEFVFSTLPPGTYTAEVAKAGFQLFKQEGVVLAASSAQRLTVMLSVGRISETINVTGQRSQVQPADTNRPPQRLRVGGGVQHAKLVRQARPAYPEHLKAAGIEGTVLIEAVIGRDGTIQNVQVLNSMVHADLVQAAVEAVRQWQWEPTYLNGQPIEIVTQITVNFTLTK